MCVCVCACVRARAPACERLLVRALVCACVFALTGHVRAHVKLCICLCLHVHVRAGVGAHACAFAGVGQRTCGLCVRACVRVNFYACMIIILFYYICRLSVYVRVCVRVFMYVHANVGLCANECVYTGVRVWGCLCACMCVH